VKLGREILAGLPLHPGALGKRVFENVPAEAWKNGSNSKKRLSMKTGLNPPTRVSGRKTENILGGGRTPAVVNAPPPATARGSDAASHSCI
jgi:hypothetical protein